MDEELVKQFSDILKEKNIDLNSILSNLNSNSSNSDKSQNTNNNSNNSGNSENIDIETLLKLKTILEKVNNKNNPSSNLLLALKPYLKDSRKSKIEQYVQLLNIAQAFNIFGKLGGDK